MPVAKDLIHETSTSTGTGNLTLAAVNGKVRFSNASHAFSTGGTNVFDYFVSNRDAAEWERGTGHMSDANTLVRDTVLRSSNSNNAVNFSAGTKDVTNDIPADNQARLETGSFTPTLEFGGGASGQSYTTRTGRYTKLGKLVTVSITIALLNKGSSTGQATITGLPFTDDGTNATFNAYVATSNLTTQHLQPFIDGNTIRLRFLTGGDSGAMTHSEFNNTTVVRISGSYVATT